MQLQFQIFQNYLVLQLQFFFPELILHKYSVEGYSQTFCRLVACVSSLDQSILVQ